MSNFGVQIDTSYIYNMISHHYAGREYHNLRHVSSMVDYLRLNIDEIKPVCPEEIMLASFFHDIVYIPGRDDNEEKSSDFAHLAMQAMGLGKTISARIVKMIRYGSGQSFDSEWNADLHIFHDLDFMILGSEKSTYDFYAEDIKKEYTRISRISEKDFHDGRRRWLSDMLKKRIFFHDHFLVKFEDKAKENISRELEGQSF